VVYALDIARYFPIWHLPAALYRPTWWGGPMLPPQQDELGVSEVAKDLGISESRVRQLDDILQPFRDCNGHRVYKREVIENFLGYRDIHKLLETK
jgi:hypothetical protein